MVEFLNDTVDISNFYLQFTVQFAHRWLVQSVVMYFTVFQHECSNFQVPNYYHYYNPNGGKKICYLLMDGHADVIFVDVWMCWV